MKRPGKVPVPAIERLMARIRIVDVDGCWEWPGNKSAGYGQIKIGSLIDGSRRQASTHRLTYEHFVGEIPEGLVIDHLCRNRACCNPAHLEPVTHRENILRGTGQSARNVVKSHCPQGHPYDQTNTYHWKGSRQCMTCRKAVHAKGQ